MNTGKDRQQTSIRLSLEAKMLIEELANAFGINQTAVIEQAIRRWARQENIMIAEETRLKFDISHPVLAEEQDALSESTQLLSDYWQEFISCLENQDVPLRPTKPQHNRWLSWMRFGRGGIHLAAHIRLNQGLIGVALTFDRKAKEYFYQLQEQKDAIEEQIGIELEWHPRPGKGESWILIRRQGDFTNRQDWGSQHEWLCNMLEAFYKTFIERIRKLKDQ